MKKSPIPQYRKPPRPPPNRVFSLTWSASMQIYCNKRRRLHRKRVKLPQDLFGTPTWPPFHCFGTPIWPPWRHVKTLYTFVEFQGAIIGLRENTGYPKLHPGVLRRIDSAGRLDGDFKTDIQITKGQMNSTLMEKWTTKTWTGRSALKGIHATSSKIVGLSGPQVGCVASVFIKDSSISNTEMKIFCI